VDPGASRDMQSTFSVQFIIKKRFVNVLWNAPGSPAFHIVGGQTPAKLKEPVPKIDNVNG
jgi:hypothetical protein